MGRAGVEPAEIIKDDPPGTRLVSGFREAATENAEVGRALQENLEARGVSPFRRRLFEIDGSKGLRKAVGLVFGGDNPWAILPQPQGAEWSGALVEGSSVPGADQAECGVPTGSGGGGVEA